MDFYLDYNGAFQEKMLKHTKEMREFARLQERCKIYKGLAMSLIRTIHLVILIFYIQVLIGYMDTDVSAVYITGHFTTFEWHRVYMLTVQYRL